MKYLIWLFLFISCTFLMAENNNIVVRLWTFNNELIKGGAIKSFEKNTPGVSIDITIVPHDMYHTELKKVLDTDIVAPDLFLVNAGFVKKFVESGHCDNLRDDPYNADVKDLWLYQVKMGTDSNGILRMLSWQIAPGGFFYRLSMANKYLGTDDPDKIGKMLNSTENFLKTARKLSENSNGDIKIIAGIHDYQEFPFSSRKEGFINSKGELVIDSALIIFLDIADTLHRENLTADLNRRLVSEYWFKNMKNNGRVFGYILPTWGLPILKENAPDAEGDYGLTNGPNPYFWGGTWIGIYKLSKNKTLAWKFVKMMTLNKDFLRQWAKTTSDFVGHQAVIREIKDSFLDPYLNGQNHYDFFASEAPNVNADIICNHEYEIRDMFMDTLMDYLKRKHRTKEEAISAFKKKVKDAYPHIITHSSSILSDSTIQNDTNNVQ